MADLFNTTILCDKCNKKTNKIKILKDGFPIRSWQCLECKQTWPHPIDIEDYKNYKEIRKKEFKSKLRMVGNSYTISIPREIIDFEQEMSEEFDKMLRLALEGPGKLSIFFKKRRIL